MDMDLIRGLLTAVLFVLFIGLWLRSWSKKRHSEYDAAAQLPLEEGDAPPKQSSREQV